VKLEQILRNCSHRKRSLIDNNQTQTEYTRHHLSLSQKLLHTRLATAKDRATAFVIDLQKFSSHLVWSPCKIWLSFLILCARM